MLLSGQHAAPNDEIPSVREDVGDPSTAKWEPRSMLMMDRPHHLMEHRHVSVGVKLNEYQRSITYIDHHHLMGLNANQFPSVGDLPPP
eukprot:COSAG02_NODE_1864_length_10606_cov_17.350148_6_plen_88_part_00